MRSYSVEGDEEIVHCQGHAVWSEEAGPGKLDIERLKREIGQGGRSRAVYTRGVRGRASVWTVVAGNPGGLSGEPGGIGATATAE